MNRTVFWYKVIIQDKRGAIAYKEGDLCGSNVLSCVRCIENMNRNTWKGQFMQLSVYPTDMETGEIKLTDPVMMWSRDGGVYVGDIAPDLRTELKDQDDDNEIDWGIFGVPYNSDPIKEKFDPKEIGTETSFCYNYSTRSP
jgi:hypothetical protein